MRSSSPSLTHTFPCESIRPKSVDISGVSGCSTVRSAATSGSTACGSGEVVTIFLRGWDSFPSDAVRGGSTQAYLQRYASILNEIAAKLIKKGVTFH